MSKEVMMIEAIIYRYESDRRLFLLLQRSVEDGGFWQPVTGSLEPDETVQNGLRREIGEETGIDAIRSVTDKLHQFIWYKGDQTMSEQAYGVLVDDVPIQLSHEHTAYRWCQLDEAMDLLKFEDNRQAFQSLERLLATKT